MKIKFNNYRTYEYRKPNKKIGSSSVEKRRQYYTEKYSFPILDMNFHLFTLRLNWKEKPANVDEY